MAPFILQYTIRCIPYDVYEIYTCIYTCLHASLRHSEKPDCWYVPAVLGWGGGGNAGEGRGHRSPSVRQAPQFSRFDFEDKGILTFIPYFLTDELLFINYYY